MFKGLRRRFIFINLSLLLAVLLAIFSGIFLLMERAVRQESLFQLERLLGGSVFEGKNGGRAESLPEGSQAREDRPAPAGEHRGSAGGKGGG